MEKTRRPKKIYVGLVNLLKYIFMCKKFFMYFKQGQNYIVRRTKYPKKNKTKERKRPTKVFAGRVESVWKVLNICWTIPLDISDKCHVGWKKNWDIRLFPRLFLLLLLCPKVLVEQLLFCVEFSFLLWLSFHGCEQPRNWFTWPWKVSWASIRVISTPVLGKEKIRLSPGRHASGIPEIRIREALDKLGGRLRYVRFSQG